MDNSSSLPLDDSERRHYDELKLAAPLTAQALRSVSAELQRLMKFTRDQRPVGEVMAPNRNAAIATQCPKLTQKVGVGAMLYTNPFAGDYVSLIQVWKGLRDLSRLTQTTQANSLAFQHELRRTRDHLEELLLQHHIELPEQD